MEQSVMLLCNSDMTESHELSVHELEISNSNLISTVNPLNGLCQVIVSHFQSYPQHL